MWTIIAFAAVLIVLVVITLFLLRFRGGNVVENYRVLTCSLGDDPTITQQTNEDHEVYNRHYPLAEKERDLQITQLMKLMIERQYAIVHIIAKYDESGNLLDRDGQILTPQELFKTAHQSKVVILYLAGNRDGRADITNYWVNALEKGFHFLVVVRSPTRELPRVDTTATDSRRCWRLRPPNSRREVGSDRSGSRRSFARAAPSCRRTTRSTRTRETTSPAARSR